MIDESKILYEQCADMYIPNWREISRSELCRKYAATDDAGIKDGCVSAIICKDWGLIGFSYQKQPYISIEEWYDTILDAIMYILETKPWEDTTSKLYKDPKGPEKALHRCIFSRRLNTYTFYTRDKRKINKNQYSIDKMQEDVQNVEPAISFIDTDKLALIDLISNVFSGNGELGVLLDLLSNNNYQFPLKPKLVVQDIQKLNHNYVEYFTAAYDVEEENVKKTIDGLKKKCNSNYIEKLISELRDHQDILELFNKNG